MEKQIKTYNQILTFVGVIATLYSVIKGDWNTIIYLSVALLVLEFAQWISSQKAMFEVFSGKTWGYLYLIICTILFLYASRPAALDDYNNEVYHTMSSVLPASLNIVVLTVIKIAIVYVSYSYLILAVKLIDPRVGKQAIKVHTGALLFSTVLFFLPVIFLLIYSPGKAYFDWGLLRVALLVAVIIGLPLLFFIPYKVMIYVNEILRNNE